MASAITRSSIWSRGPFIFGVVLTIVVLAFAAFSLFSWPPCVDVGPCKSNWDVLRFDSKPNEIGDLLAGFAGALAFIWIVVTVLLQAAELREQREQFEKMADAQEEQVLLLVKQGEIFSEEQDYRRSENVWRIIEEKLQVVIFHIEAIPIRCRKWSFTPHPPKGMRDVAKPEWRKKYSRHVKIFESDPSLESNLAKLAKWSRELHFLRAEVMSFLASAEKERGLLSTATRYQGYSQILELLKELCNSKAHVAGDAHTIRFEGLGLEKLVHDLEAVLIEDGLWAGGEGITPP
ncbi:hypothetical protein [Sulfitobacter noctilucae]|uniref:hypothetical protein n=1 Tax=Sulfitobacter noctilucae TaxID=1342302 RepID=UPI000468EBB2|nr:hypothetical protein [Sulfitobacter noctilucae]